MPNLLNQLQATSVRRFTPWKGAWFADVEVALDETGIPPLPGPCVLTLGIVPLVGTVDPRASGSFAKSAKVRVIAGGAGWDKQVLPLPIANPAGVLSSQVYALTAAEVLEAPPVDIVPSVLGSTVYLRHGGPASAVFGGRDWYVNPLGITIVGPRIPLPYDPTSAEILSWDPLTRIATVSSDAPIEPGTILLDPLRFDGPLIVRDVEQTWDADGARATCWCADDKGSRLSNALGALVAAKAGLPFLKVWEYRVVLQPTTDTLALQIVDVLSTAPNALPIDIWYGVPGASAKLLPGSIVLVAFANGDPGKPCVVGFKSGAVPLELSFDAIRVAAGLGVMPVVVGSPAFIAWVSAITTAVNGLAPGSAVPPIPLVSTNMWAD